MKNRLILSTGLFIILAVAGCNIPQYTARIENKNMPEDYGSNATDTATAALLNWRDYFNDNQLSALIDTALKNNQELNIIMQEIEISKNEIRVRKGEYLPFLNIGGGAGLDRVGQYTRSGAVEDQLEIKPGKSFPEPLQDYMIGASASWEIDIWKKLRNAKQSAVMNYMAGIDGKNFMQTNMVAEIASSYYELMALDNLQDIIQSNIVIQSNALNIVKQQKDAAKVSQLAVNRFEAQLLNTTNLQYEVQQQIVQTENRIHFLTGKFPTSLQRNSAGFLDLNVDSMQTGVPAQLLVNRPDIRKAENELAAARLDIKVAKAAFYPSLDIKAGMGFQAFNPAYLINPESIIYNLAGEMMAPLVNRNAIQANYSNANARQIQAAYTYEQSALNAYVDVLNQLSKMKNYSGSYQTKKNEVDILLQSVTIANSLFNSARADYMEVLLTQEEALKSKMELVEIKLSQMRAKVNLYRALGGGWR